MENLSKLSEYKLGDIVKKKSGSEWEGVVCGHYLSSSNNIGCAVESSSHKGSVQIYPNAALVLV